MAESATKSLVRRFMACALSAGLLASSVRPAAGSEEATGPEPQRHRPTTAFLDLDGSPLARLLEQRLLVSTPAAWLERNRLDELLREQKLQGLVDAAATRRRVSIGKLLKADLLVLLRHLETPKEHVQLVVCETSRGLRLAVHRVVISPKVEEDVRRLADFVERAIEKRGQEIREICAVPPFVSNDLTYENEHLKAAYAKLAEQTVRNRPGLLLVELEEARAIAREVALAGRQIRRPLPLYLLGEFRHQGNGDQQKATLRMRAVRGKQVLANREASGLSPTDAVKFVQQASNELIRQTIGVRPLPPNSKLEAEQLARRAGTFHLLGSWDEAAALAEASLLLDSRQPRMREVAASSLGFLARRYADYNKGADSVARGIHLYLLALEHYETILPETRRVDESAISPDTKHFGESDLWGLHKHLFAAVHWANLSNEHNSPADVRRVVAELQKQELEILLRIVRRRSRAKTGDEYRFMAWALFRFPPKEQFQILLETIGTIQHLPDAQRLTRTLTLRGYTVNILDTPEGRQYLKALLAIDNPAVQRAALELHGRLQQYTASKARQQPAKLRSIPPPAGPQQLRFHPVEIGPRSEDGNLRPRWSFNGCIPAGPGVDLLWASGPHLYVMRQPGRLKEIWSSEYNFGPSITDIDYDGRFAWVTTRHLRGKPKLLVVDPQEEKVWEINGSDGLPVVAWETIPDRIMWAQLWAEPLEPGKILLVSWFGRMAIGTVTFDPDKGPQVDVFFEARNPLDRTKGEPWRDPHMAFPPGYVIGFHGTDEHGRPLRKVLVGALSQFSQYGRHDRPLLVDPDLRGVAVLPHKLRGGLEPRRLAFTREAVYRVQLFSKGLRLERIGLPDLKSETLMAGVPEGYCVKYGDKFAVLGSRCWLLDPKAPPQQRVRVIAARPPWKYRNHCSTGVEFAGPAAETPNDLLPFQFKGIWRSSHFGLLAVRFSREHRYEFLRIVFDQE